MKKCDEWDHQWGPSASPEYEMCQRCKVWRKKEKPATLPPVEKKEQPHAN